MDISIKSDRGVKAVTGYDSGFTSYEYGFFEKCADISIKECRAEVEHIHLDNRICRELVLCEFNYSESGCDLLRDLRVNWTPNGGLYGVVVENPSCEVCYTLEIDFREKRMFLYKVLVNIFDDSYRHYLIVEQSVHCLYGLFLAGLDNALIEILFLCCEDSETSLKQNVLISVC